MDSAKNEVEMESCSESMAPGAWAGSTAANINKFKNDGSLLMIFTPAELLTPNFSASKGRLQRHERVAQARKSLRRNTRC